jgi:hypothetical protein
LRTRQHALNQKLEAAGYGAAVFRPEPGRLRLSKKEDRDSEHLSAAGADENLARVLREVFGERTLEPPPSRKSVAECAAEIRKALSNGPLSVWELRRLCREKGYPEGTVKKARKRLGVIARREGNGGDGEWIVYLPPN